MQDRYIKNDLLATMGQMTKVLLFIKLLPNKYAKFGPKIQSTTKHDMFRATNLRQS